MKTNMHGAAVVILLGLSAFLLSLSCNTSQKSTAGVYADTLFTNVNGNGLQLVLQFEKGASHNHPTMAVWIEDMNQNYLQTLYVTQSLATGIYGHGAKSDNEWMREPGEARRPATLPYFLHKRGIKAPDNTYLPTPDNPIPDAYTGATPQASFLLNTKSDKPLGENFRLMVEINQPWDFNEYWFTNKFPERDYNTSCQPSLIYSVTINPKEKGETWHLNPIGHGHYAGKDGKLYTDISGFTTALEIMKSITVKLL